MKLMALTDFRRKVGSLASDVQVTANGSVIGTWKPSIWQIAHALDLEAPDEDTLSRLRAENEQLRLQLGEGTEYPEGGISAHLTATHHVVALPHSLLGKRSLHSQLHMPDRDVQDRLDALVGRAG